MPLDPTPSMERSLTLRSVCGASPNIRAAPLAATIAASLSGVSSMEDAEVFDIKDDAATAPATGAAGAGEKGLWTNAGESGALMFNMAIRFGADAACWCCGGVDAAAVCCNVVPRPGGDCCCPSICMMSAPGSTAARGGTATG